MIQDLIFQSQHTIRRLQHQPRFFANEIGPLIPNLIPTSEEPRRTDEESKKQTDEQLKRGAQQQARQPQQTQQTRPQALDQTARDDRAADRASGEERHAENQARREGAGQGLKDIRHSEFVENQPQQVHTGSAFRAPSSAGGSVLQNVRVLTGQANPEANAETFHSQNEGSLPSLLRGNEASTPLPMTGGRIADFNRSGGLHEGGQTPFSQLRDNAARFNQAQRGPQQPQGFHPDSPFAQLPGQAFHRTWSPDNMAQLLNQAAAHLADSHPELMQQAGRVAVLMNGSVLFVRDGDRIRAFRLTEDGTLYESSSEHEGVPLSAEARAEMAKFLKSRGLHAKLSGEKEALVDQPSDLKGEEKDHSLAARGEFKALFKDDSSFAQLLRKALEEGHEIGEYLEPGADAQFADKADWDEFFARMLKLGSSETPQTKSFDEVMSFIFRGLFKKKGQGSQKEEGQTLVSDIRYQGEELPREDKFAQVGIHNEELLEYLKNLKPGQPISKEMLQKFMGDELNFTRLIHVLQKTDPALASSLYKNVQFDATGGIDLFSQARLEHHIFSKSRKSSESSSLSSNTLHGNIPANTLELENKQKEERLGPPKLYTLFAYALIIFGLLMLFYFLFRK
ncbi:MAG: hypothetical protein JNK65_02385 [Deltaproteobacteria bacterium]|nr:hypothetical protein [Deltaproteobacteria bacterium]